MWLWLCVLCGLLDVEYKSSCCCCWCSSFAAVYFIARRPRCGGISRLFFSVKSVSRTRPPVAAMGSRIKNASASPRGEYRALAHANEKGLLYRRANLSAVRVDRRFFFFFWGGGGGGGDEKVLFLFLMCKNTQRLFFEWVCISRRNQGAVIAILIIYTRRYYTDWNVKRARGESFATRKVWYLYMYLYRPWRGKKWKLRVTELYEVNIQTRRVERAAIYIGMSFTFAAGGGSKDRLLCL